MKVYPKQEGTTVVYDPGSLAVGDRLYLGPLTLWQKVKEFFGFYQYKTVTKVVNPSLVEIK